MEQQEKVIPINVKEGPDLTGITKLDLGDTYHGEGAPLEEGWISIALDETDKLVGDYTKTPFPDNSFEYAYGACYLEFEDNISGLDLSADAKIPFRDDSKYKEGIIAQFTELFRILKPGGTAELSACGCLDINDEGEEEEWHADFVKTMHDDLQMYGKLAQQVGFITDLDDWKYVPDEELEYGGKKYTSYSIPMITIQKPY